MHLLPSKDVEIRHIEMSNIKLFEKNVYVMRYKSFKVEMNVWFFVKNREKKN